MKFLVDAQLPRQLARQILASGYQAIHTLELPAKNRTEDESLRKLADRDGWMIVTKDSDFVDSHILRGQPPLLLLVTTGNITNDELLAIFSANLSAIVQAFATSVFVEVDRTGLTIRA